MAGTNRVGRVSSIDYESGTYEVTYADQGRRVTARINAMSNGEYKMPRVGQIVSVTHTSNGTAAATTSGTVWNRSNRPAEGFAGLYRKEYGEKAGQAFERYDANTGIYTQYTDVRTGRNCNGDIFDEAKVTQVYQPGKAKHPYHLVAVSGGGSTVYGWVDAADIGGSATGGTRTHTVVRGDTLWALASTYLGSGSRYKEIMRLNGLTSEIIHVGQVLKMPAK